MSDKAVNFEILGNIGIIKKREHIDVLVVTKNYLFQIQNLNQVLDGHVFTMYLMIIM